MKHGKLATLALLFTMLFSFSLCAEDLFDLDGGSEPAPEEDSVVPGADEGAPVDSPVVEEKKEETKAPKTAALEVSQAANDTEGEKKLRELTIEEKKKIKVVQKKEFYKDGRFELGVDLGFIGGDWHNVFVTGARMAYHINEYFAAQGRFLYGPFTIERDTWKQAGEATADVSTSNLVMAGGASVVFSPIYGKVSIFGNFIPKYDLNVSMGAFFYQTEVEQDTETDKNNNFAVQLGLAGRFFLSNNFTINLNMDWFMMQDKRPKLGGDNAGSKSYLKSDFMFTVSGSMFLPFD